MKAESKVPAVCPFKAGDTVELWPGGPEAVIGRVSSPDGDREVKIYFEGQVEWTSIYWPVSPFCAAMRLVAKPAEAWDDIEAAGWEWDGENESWPDFENGGIQIRTGCGAGDSTLGMDLNFIRTMIGLPLREVKGAKS